MLKNLEQSIHEVLSLKQLTPSPSVNQTMSQLVQSVIDAGTARPTGNVHTVRKVSAKAESAMEFWWAKKIISSSDPAATLASFPYTINYTELVAREVSLLAASGWVRSNHSRVLLIGSGPLPLTAIELQRQLAVTQVDQVDSSYRAVSTARRLMKALGQTAHIIRASGQAVRLHHKYDVIYIAALAGETVEDKQSIINAVLPYLTADGRIVIRSAYGAREVLYPLISALSFTGVHLMKEYHPYDDVINSVFIYKKERT